MIYYVSKEAQESGDHEVHRATCPVLPKEEKLQYLGKFVFCSSAIAEARKYFEQVNGCETCSRFNHVKTD